MANKKINFGQVGPAGDTVSVTATLEDDTLGTGDRTIFFVALERNEGPTITSLTIWAILIGASSLDLYPPFHPIGNGRIGALEPGESKRVDFLINNESEGASPAVYSLLCVIQWADHRPFVLPLFKVP